MLFTIGYERATIEGFLDALRKHQIERVIDVRRNPISRKPGFSKSALARHLSGAGIAYTHIGDLGPPIPLRQEYKATKDIDAYFAQFSNYLCHCSAPLSEVAEMAGRERCVVLCFERNPEECHRSVVANTISEVSSVATRDLFVQEHEGA
jgi:uncharacterized protein (DUF488 family)